MNNLFSVSEQFKQIIVYILTYTLNLYFRKITVKIMLILSIMYSYTNFTIIDYFIEPNIKKATVSIEIIK